MPRESDRKSEKNPVAKTVLETDGRIIIMTMLVRGGKNLTYFLTYM